VLALHACKWTDIEQRLKGSQGFASPFFLRFFALLNRRKPAIVAKLFFDSDQPLLSDLRYRFGFQDCLDSLLTSYGGRTLITNQNIRESAPIEPKYLNVSR